MTMKQLGFPENFADSTDVHWHWIDKGVYCQTPGVYLSSANGLRRDWRDRQHRRQVQPRGGHAVRTEALHFRVRREQAASRPAERHQAGKNIAAPLNAKRLNQKNTVCG